MSATTNFSQMLIDISGDLLESVPNSREMQSRVDMVVMGWNMSLLSKAERQLKMKRFLRKLKGTAPSKEALKGLEQEIKKVVKHKLNLYPDNDTELLRAEVLEHSQGNHELKVYFKDKEEMAKQQLTQHTVFKLNQNMARAQSDN